MNDIINALFELCGAVLTWVNVSKILKDKKVVGVYWPIWIFFSLWGLWNLFYYPSVGHMLSFYAGIVLVAGNITWVIIAFCYMRRKT